jgi:hypothetical protein
VRGAVALVSSERRSILPSRLLVIIAVTVARAGTSHGGGRIRATMFGAQPNQRLKLAAPVLYNDGVNLSLRYRRIAFVEPTTWRRSLRAFR